MITVAITAPAANKGDKQMKGKILVVYCSQAGSTAEIAQFIGKEISAKGWNSDVKNVNEVTNPAQYNAIIIGSPIYAGKWKKEATDFIQTNQSLLQQKHVAYFAVGMFFADPAKKAETSNYLQRERALVKPLSEGHFMGRLDYSKLNFFSRTICKMIKAKQGDFRNWAAIKTWTHQTLALFD
jgi:menaquinone-dependent protoporphyrinogen oxidase